jgi:hypothetical protein
MDEWYGLTGPWNDGAPRTISYVLLAAMLTVVGSRLLLDRRARIAGWRHSPDSLLHIRQPGLAELVIVIVLATISAALSLVRSPAMGAFIAVCAAVSVMTLAHLRQSAAAGAYGLAILPVAYVVLARWFVPSDPARLVAGLAAGGLQLLWLARFWTQQLAASGPWTTAGRLIPAARALSWAVTGVEALVVALAALMVGWWDADVGPAAYLVLLATVLHIRLLARDAREGGRVGSAVAAALAAPAVGFGVYLVLPVPVRSLLLAGAVGAVIVAWCLVRPLSRRSAQG